MPDAADRAIRMPVHASIGTAVKLVTHITHPTLYKVPVYRHLAHAPAHRHCWYYRSPTCASRREPCLMVQLDEQELRIERNERPAHLHFTYHYCMLVMQHWVR